MNCFRKMIGAALAVALALAPGFGGFSASAQTYPTTSPAYIPTAILGATTLSAAGTYVFQTNGVGELYLRVSGTNTGVTGTVQVTEARAPSTVAWSNRSVVVIGGTRAATITGDGLYRLNTAGVAQVRFNLTAIGSGSVVLTASASAGSDDTTVMQGVRATYSAAIAGLVTATSATDLVVINGSATATVRLVKAECSGIAGTAGIADILGIVRSTADSSGTSTTLTNIPADANNAAGSAVVKAYTVNPTTGTAVGTARAGKLALPLATANTNMPLVWTFGTGPGEQEVVLRGVAQSFAINGNGATLAATASLNCDLTWTEE